MRLERHVEKWVLMMSMVVPAFSGTPGKRPGGGGKARRWTGHPHLSGWHPAASPCSPSGFGRGAGIRTRDLLRPRQEIDPLQVIVNTRLLDAISTHPPSCPPGRVHPPFIGPIVEASLGFVSTLTSAKTGAPRHLHGRGTASCSQIVRATVSRRRSPRSPGTCAGKHTRPRRWELRVAYLSNSVRARASGSESASSAR